MKFKNLTIPILVIAFLASALVAATAIEAPPVILPEEENPPKLDENPDAAFHKMMDVLTHQRCVNCHPSDDVPKQGEDRHPHRFGITRANSASGMAATNCNTCHQDSNNNNSGVPGAPEWSLAPPQMQWEGLDRYEIAASMTDRSKNGNRSLEELMHHLTEHELVLWAWEPGVDAEGNPRELPPVSKEEYIAAVKEWIEAGANIPERN